MIVFQTPQMHSKISSFFLLLLSGAGFGVSYYFDCQGIRRLKPVSVYAFILCLISTISNFFIFLLFTIIKFRHQTSYHLNLKKYFLFSIKYITIPLALYFFSLPSLRSSSTSICAPFGDFIVILYKIFFLRQKYIAQQEFIYIIILFSSFFVLYSQILYRASEEENPLLVIVKYISSIIGYGIFYLAFYEFNTSLNESKSITSQLKENSIIIFFGSITSTLYFFIISLFQCNLSVIYGAVIRAFFYEKPWPFISALLKIVLGQHFYFYLIRLDTKAVGYLPYIIMIAGLPLSFTVLDEIGLMKYYERYMKIASIILNLLSLIPLFFPCNK